MAFAVEDKASGDRCAECGAALDLDDYWLIHVPPAARLCSRACADSLATRLGVTCLPSIRVSSTRSWTVGGPVVAK